MAAPPNSPPLLRVVFLGFCEPDAVRTGSEIGPVVYQLVTIARCPEGIAVAVFLRRVGDVFLGVRTRYDRTHFDHFEVTFLDALLRRGAAVGVLTGVGKIQERLNACLGAVGQFYSAIFIQVRNRA